MSRKNPPRFVMMFAGVWSAAASVSCMDDRTCSGMAFCVIFAFLSMMAFAELDDGLKEQGR